VSNIIIPSTADATVTDQHGNRSEVRGLALSDEQAKILREYKKKVLLPLGLREALFCGSCGNASLEDGCKSFVTDSDIGIFCRCTMRHYKGQTF
jgi:hypothetical protein